MDCNQKWKHDETGSMKQIIMTVQMPKAAVNENGDTWNWGQTQIKLMVQVPRAAMYETGGAKNLRTVIKKSGGANTKGNAKAEGSNDWNWQHKHHGWQWIWNDSTNTIGSNEFKLAVQILRAATSKTGGKNMSIKTWNWLQANKNGSTNTKAATNKNGSANTKGSNEWSWLCKGWGW